MSQNKTLFPSFFIIDNKEITNKEIIAANFNDYFTNIGPKLAAKINSTNKPSYMSFLTNPTEHTFSFAEVDSGEITQIIQTLNQKPVLGMTICQ